MKNWKKAIALVASAAALVSVAACGSSNAGGSSDSGKKTVGFVLEQDFGKDLSRKKYYHRGQYGVGRHCESRIHTLEERVVKQAGNEYAVHYKHYVVAHKHRTDKAVGMSVKQRYQFLGKTAMVLVHLHQHTVARDKSYLHAGKESRHDHRHKYAGQKRNISFQNIML